MSLGRKTGHCSSDIALSRASMLKQKFYFSRFFLASSCDDIDYGGNYDGRTFGTQRQQRAVRQQLQRN